ncbi:MAG: hypothetical protein LC785_07450, partial [Acidobacteria bacterium]|nr:hypothetical protein [Acidobacteriota bacterium]MCA1641771.1 hypothetical protein [Acidobacteriota bacterium]
MKKRAVRLLSFALAFAAALAAPAERGASAHKFHTSFAEADYDAATRSLQITLRTFPDDLESAIRRRGGGRVSPDDKKAFGARVFEYLQETFRLKTARGEAVKLSWVGMEAGTDSAWL